MRKARTRGAASSASQAVTFEAGVAAARGPVSGVYNPGLQALGGDRDAVHCADTRRLTGSINLDVTLAETLPHAARWDYGIGYRSPDSEAECAIWIEVHPANSGHVKDVIAKAAWLKQYLCSDAPLLATITTAGAALKSSGIASPYVWVSTDRVALPRSSPARRALSKAGIHVAGRVLSLP